MSKEKGMDRGLIAGAIGFGLAFGAERLYASLEPDIARYERMREMSGQKPILKELFSLVAGAFGSSGENGRGLIAGLTNDVVRSARIRGM
jgi:hypothetical protein